MMRPIASNDPIKTSITTVKPPMVTHLSPLELEIDLQSTLLLKAGWPSVPTPLVLSRGLDSEVIFPPRASLLFMGTSSTKITDTEMEYNLFTYGEGRNPTRKPSREPIETSPCH
jgi:hypothetical protein